MPKYVRARQGTGILRHPESGNLAAPNPAQPFSEDDPLVKAFPWAFVSDEELAAEPAELESATRRPGEKRTTRRQK